MTLKEAQTLLKMTQTPFSDVAVEHNLSKPDHVSDVPDAKRRRPLPDNTKTTVATHLYPCDAEVELAFLN